MGQSQGNLEPNPSRVIAVYSISKYLFNCLKHFLFGCVSLGVRHSDDKTNLPSDCNSGLQKFSVPVYLGHVVPLC